MTSRIKTKLITLIKNCVCAAIVVMAVNVCVAEVSIGIGVGGDYPYSCQPGYWDDNGFWIPGTCGNDYYYPAAYSGAIFIFNSGGDHEHHEHHEWGGGGNWGGGGKWHGGGNWHHH